MVRFDTVLMRQVGSLVHTNGGELQSDYQTFWNLFSSDASQAWGNFPAFHACMADFQTSCQRATQKLAANQVDLAGKLIHFADVVDQNAIWVRRGFRAW